MGDRPVAHRGPDRGGCSDAAREERPHSPSPSATRIGTVAWLIPRAYPELAMTRKRERDFVADVQDWSEQSSSTRSWTPSPAGGSHPLRLRGAARSLPRLALYMLLGRRGAHRRGRDLQRTDELGAGNARGPSPNSRSLVNAHSSACVPLRRASRPATTKPRKRRKEATRPCYVATSSSMPDRDPDSDPARNTSRKGGREVAS
jgi:hypothetical protein